MQVTGNFQTNSSIALREAILAGMGIALVPVRLLGNHMTDGHLKSVLPDYQPAPFPIHAVYRRSRFQPAKVKAFIDSLADEFHRCPWVSDDGQPSLHG